jgi:1-acyl-sn-glycerol-3-phosphate acyltransferase
VIYAVRYALIALYTVFWGLPCIVLALFDRSGEAAVWIGRHWVSWILWTIGVEVVAEGLENIDRARPGVLMSNHQSVFDIAALVVTLPVSWRFVAKRELTWIPIFGWALALSGQVIIDRSDREQAVRSMREAAKKIRGGTKVIVFPEGTRSTSGRMREFKSGGFHLAIANGWPIVPASVSGSMKVTPKRSLRVDPGLIKVRYGEPIPTSKLTLDDRHELKAQVRQAIADGMDLELQAAAGGAQRAGGE